MNNLFAEPNAIILILTSAVLGMLPIIMMTTTSYAKISVVLSIVRNALGIQQTPPNLLLASISLILTAYIMAPVGQEMYKAFTDPRANYSTVVGWEKSVTEIVAPLKNFLLTHADPNHRKFFHDATKQLWKNGPPRESTDSDFTILIPAFLISELTRAFEIAFLLYLPFLMVDLVVSTILVAMGMSMMSPPVISTPLKILLFVMVDGWSRLLEGLVLSYVPGG